MFSDKPSKAPKAQITLLFGHRQTLLVLPQDYPSRSVTSLGHVLQPSVLLGSSNDVTCISFKKVGVQSWDWPDSPSDKTRLHVIPLAQESLGPRKIWLWSALIDTTLIVQDSNSWRSHKPLLLAFEPEHSGSGWRPPT